jgi:hypothetical protein
VIDLSVLSAFGGNEGADFAGVGKDHVCPVTHHSGINKSGRILFRAIIARIGLQAKIAFPKLAGPAISSCDCV